MRTIPITLIVCMALISCTKNETVTPTQPSNNAAVSDKDIYIFTIVDGTSQIPVDSAQVMFAFGNGYGDINFTGVDGKANFSIPKGWVTNELRVMKNNYCYFYTAAPGSEFNQVILLYRFAYLKIRAKNIAPALASDRIEIAVPSPVWASFDANPSFVGIIDTTYITKARNGNLGINYSVFSGTTLISSNQLNVMAPANDTTDVVIEF